MAYNHSLQKPTYGHCDTFFVENEQQGTCAQRMQAREHARIVARERQRAMAAELSTVTSEEYQEDVLEYMEFMEVSISLLSVPVHR